MKIGLSHALGTHIESLYDEKKIPEMNSVAKNASPSFVEITKIDIFETLEKMKIENRP